MDEFLCKKCGKLLQFDPSLFSLDDSIINTILSKDFPSNQDAFVILTPNRSTPENRAKNSTINTTNPMNLVNTPTTNKKYSKTPSSSPSSSSPSSSSPSLTKIIARKASPFPIHHQQHTNQSPTHSGSTPRWSSQLSNSSLSTSNTPTSPSTSPPNNNSNDNYSLEKLQLIEKLFDLATNSTEVDHPLCSECIIVMSKHLETMVEVSHQENNAYRAFLLKLQDHEITSPTDSELDQEIQQFEQEEKDLREKFILLEQERQQVKREMEMLNLEDKKIELIEERYWQQFSGIQQDCEQLVEDRDALKKKIENGEQQLQRLKETNVYNDIFHIWHDGHFGTINNFRLGRLPSRQVDWNEINAAWGQAALLLYTMAKKLDYQFTTYRLVPMGSCSKVERIDDNTTYELYGSNDISLGRLFWNRRFDTAMVAFLKCLKELGDYAETTDKNFHLPYRMDKEKIGEVSIKIQFNPDETWTKALKYMLTNLKWLLAWMSKITKEKEEIASRNCS